MEESPVQKLRPTWINDNEKKCCAVCDTAFSFLNRRHHCRACGEICCGKCSEKRMDLNDLGYIGSQRVCSRCFNEHSEDNQQTRIRRSVTSSRIICEDLLTLSDLLGRPIGLFLFSLTEYKLRWEVKGQEEGSISIQDILFVKKRGLYSFTVHSYPIKQTNEEGITRREECSICIQCETTEHRESWFSELSLLVPPHLEPIAGDVTHLLVILNPACGDKTATALAWSQTEHIFRQSDFEITYRWTERPKHAQDLIKKVKYQKFKAIICIGGDGTLHELINGILLRDDSKHASRIPISIIPAGTSNGFASQFDLLDPVNAAFRIMRGNKLNLDVMKVKIEDETRYFFQSINWGLASEIDAKNSWGNFMRVATSLKTYNGTIEYQAPINQPDLTFCNMKKDCKYCSNFDYDVENEKTEIIEGPFVLVAACNLRKISIDIAAAPFSHLADGLFDLLVIGAACSKPQFLSLMSSIGDGSFINSPTFNLNPHIKYLRVKSFTLHSTDTSSKFSADGDILPPLDTIKVSNCRYAISIIV